MKRVTVEQVMSWEPCKEYPEERIRKLLGKRNTLSAQNIIELDIPAADRMWAVLREDFFSEKDLRLIACDCAESVLHLFEEKYPEDKRPREAIEVSRRFANGQATKEELAAASAAASDVTSAAAWAAASAVAWATARAVAWATARAATWAATRNAAWAAASAVARDAARAARAVARDAARAASAVARDAASDVQIEIIKKYI